MEILWGLLALVILGALAWFVGIIRQAERNRMRRQQLEEWEGVTDVKRETKRELNDPDNLKRMHDKYNPPK